MCAVLRVVSCDFVDRGFAALEKRSTKSYETTRSTPSERKVSSGYLLVLTPEGMLRGKDRADIFQQQRRQNTEMTQGVSKKVHVRS
jgi:hypothetical protein